MKFISFIIVIAFTLYISQNVYGQEKGEVNYHKYKNEIGIDFQHLFGTFYSSPAIGTSLIYKRRAPETGLIAVNEKKAYRFQLSLGGQAELGERKVDTLINTLFDLFDGDDRNYLSVGFAVGMEKQINRNRFQYSYGLDLGYRYLDERVISWLYTSSGISGKTRYIRRVIHTTSHGPTLVPFFGFKFFIVPEISLSLESGIPVTMSFISRSNTEQDLPDEEIETVKKESLKEIDFYFDFLRTLNVSYYF